MQLLGGKGQLSKRAHSKYFMHHAAQQDSTNTSHSGEFRQPGLANSTDTVRSPTSTKPGHISYRVTPISSIADSRRHMIISPRVKKHYHEHYVDKETAACCTAETHITPFPIPEQAHAAAAARPLGRMQAEQNPRREGNSQRFNLDLAKLILTTTTKKNQHTGLFHKIWSDFKTSTISQKTEIIDPRIQLNAHVLDIKYDSYKKQQIEKSIHKSFTPKLHQKRDNRVNYSTYVCISNNEQLCSIYKELEKFINNCITKEKVILDIHITVHYHTKKISHFNYQYLKQRNINTLSTQESTQIEIRNNKKSIPIPTHTILLITMIL